MTDKKEVSKETAELFYRLCAGEYSGHMASIPHSPALRELCSTHQATTLHTTKRFSALLRAVADKLDEEEI